MTDPDTKLKYEHDMMTEKDYYSILNTYRDEGIQEGIAKGKEEGFEKGTATGLAKAAKGMLQMGMSVETVMQAGLSAGEVAALH